MAYIPPTSTALRFSFGGRFGGRYEPPVSTALHFAFGVLPEDKPVLPRPYDTLSVSIAGAWLGPNLARHATSGFTTAYNDTPASTPFLGRIAEDVECVREISTVFWGGGTPRSTVGNVVLLNPDGRLDTLRSESMRDRVIELHRGTFGDPFSSWEMVVRGVVDRVEWPNEQRCDVVFQDTTALLDRPAMSNLYTDAVNTALNGQCRPLAIGECLSVPPLVFDPSGLLYDVHQRAPTSILRVRSQGNAMTPVTDWTAVGKGFQLLDAPIGRIVADVAGELGTAARLPAILRYLLVDRPISEELGRPIPPPLLATQIDWDRIYALDDAAPYQLNFFSARPTTYRQILTELADSFGGYWWVTRQGRLAFGRLALPAVTPVLEITIADLAQDADIVIRPDLAPGYSDVLCAQKNWHIHEASEIGSVLTSPVIQQIALDLQADFRYRARALSPPVDLATGSATPRPYSSLKNTGIATLLSRTADADVEIARWAALYAEQRHFCTLPLLAGKTAALGLEMGDTVRVTVPRFGLDAGKFMVVTRVPGRLLGGRIDLGTWF